VLPSRHSLAPQHLTRWANFGSRHFSFEHFVGTHKERFWDFEPERLGGFEIDNKFEFCRLLERQVCRLGSSKYLFYFRLGDIADMAGPAPGLVPLENDPEATPFKFRVRDSTRSWQPPDQSGASRKKRDIRLFDGLLFR
jgi:hypothetical protein